MTTTHSYTFDKLGRIGDDECNLSQKNVQNAEPATSRTIASADRTKYIALSVREFTLR